MKAISGALTTLFNSQQTFAKADLYTWTFADGSILRTTGADIALSFGAFTFLSCAPICERTKTRIVIGVEVDSMNVSVYPSATDMLAGLGWPTAARQGYLDGATLLVETAYITAWPTVIGTIHVFSGLVSDVSPSRTAINVTVKSALELLARPFPRNVYQSVCNHTVYDAGCTLAKAGFTFAGAVAAATTPTTVSFKTSHAQAAGYFEQGVLTFTSGANTGLKRTVKNYDPTVGFTFVLPLPVAPAIGDTMTVFAGCDKTKVTCGSKFSNIVHFNGTPFIPTPETVR